MIWARTWRACFTCSSTSTKSSITSYRIISGLLGRRSRIRAFASPPSMKTRHEHSATLFLSALRKYTHVQVCRYPMICTAPARGVIIARQWLLLLPSMNVRPIGMNCQRLVAPTFFHWSTCSRVLLTFKIRVEIRLRSLWKAWRRHDF